MEQVPPVAIMARIDPAGANKIRPEHVQGNGCGLVNYTPL
jgi:hypothetical protein